MTDEQIKNQIETIEKVTKRLLKSKKAARKFLRDAGIPVGEEPFSSHKAKPEHA